MNEQESYFSEDDEPFLIQQKQVEKALEEARSIVEKANNIMVCTDCGEDIELERKKIVPYTTLCSECARFNDKYKNKC